MKLLLFVFIFSATALRTLAQTGTIDELELRPLRLPALQEVEGSPFMTSDYKTGAVVISDTKEVTGVPVKFNIMNNAVMVQKDGQDLKLENFKQVSYDVIASDGASRKVILRTGYPDVEKNSSKTVYQVISMGPKLHLLKLLTQKVEDAPTLGEYSRREIVTTEQYFVYVPGGEIKKIKLSKKEVTAAVPSLSARIEEIAGAKDLKLKNESDFVTLVDEINKP